MDECNVEIWGKDFGHFKCHEPQVKDGVCQFHWDTGNTEELFVQNQEQIMAHARAHRDELPPSRGTMTVTSVDTETNTIYMEGEAPSA